MKKRFVRLAGSLVLAVLFACGPKPPKAADSITVGDAKGTGTSLAALPASDDIPWNDAAAAVPVAKDDPSWGQRDAFVTVVMFSDFQCPYCNRVEPTLAQVRTTYGPEKVRIVWKNQPLPFHPNAKPAAEAAQVVMMLGGNEAFWKFHDYALRNQQSLTADNFSKWALLSGVEIAAFQASMAEHRGAAKVAADQQLANEIGASGTPAFRINGVELTGAQPFDSFKTLIDRELVKARAKVDAGTPQNRLYAVMTAENVANEPKRVADDDIEEDTTTTFKVPIAGAPVRGKSTALVTIVEFSDFNCPFCKMVQPTLDAVRKKYGDDVRLVWRDEPLSFHPRALPAAQLARFARHQKGNAGFWDMHDRLFASQLALADADLSRLATAAKLDATKAMAAVAASSFKNEIEADVSLANQLQADGTPHFFINGRRIIGAVPAERFATIIDEEIKKAEALVKSGTARAAVYDTLQKDAKAPLKP